MKNLETPGKTGRVGRYVQAYPLTWSVHDPPFKQGLLEHSLMSVIRNSNTGILNF